MPLPLAFSLRRNPVQVRPHLQEVDDIPLHVPIFANCTPSSIQEMIRIYQEYGEVVCCVGSSADPDNACTFATVCEMC